MPNAYISGTGFYVPPRVVTNRDLAEQYGIDTTHDWIVQRTGIEERRFADDGVGAADLALPAAKAALERAGLTAADLDMIVFCTLSPEQAFPGSGVLLQRKLEDGLPERKFVPAMDVRNQCSGFLYGLTTATAMVRSGMFRHVLVVGSEVHSSALDLSTRGRAVACLFGDGAGAVVVSATDEDRGMRACFLGSDGRYADTLCQRVWDARRRPFLPLDENGWGKVSPEMMWAKMDGKVVFKHAVERMLMVMMQACADQNIGVQDVDLFVFHQANMRLNQYVADQMSLPAEKVVHNIHRYGNTTAATIPILLAEAERDGKLKRGMKVAMIAFGSGFTWGCTIADW